jgi:glycine cleavage system aminomethyltransferase T
MGYVSHERDVPRNQVLDGSFEIEINGKRFPATASFRPFYDPDSSQVHL